MIAMAPAAFMDNSKGLLKSTILSLKTYYVSTAYALNHTILRMILATLVQLNRIACRE